MARDRGFDGSSSRAVLSATILCLLASLFLTAYSARNPRVATVGARITQEITAPLQQGLTSATTFVGGLFQEYEALVEAREKNETLKGRLAILEMENSRLREFEVENQRLAKVLHFTESQRLHGVAARVIGKSAANWVDSVMVDAGIKSGITIGLPAVDGSGAVVGRVVTVSSGASQVLLITDRASAVDVMIQSSRARGILEGKGDGRCDLNFIDQEQEVNQGDVVITSGMDGIYPKGLTVGTVMEAEKDSRGMFQRVVIEPKVKLPRLEELLIVSNAPGAPQ